METLLELSSKNGVFSDGNNSTFTTVFGEPIRVAAGSTINFTNAFIDLGLESADLISIPTNIQLGINFYRFDEDIPKVPTTVGTAAEEYNKATIYVPETLAAATNNWTVVDYVDFSKKDPPTVRQYGYRAGVHSATCLPSILCERQSRTAVPDSGLVQETFRAIEETAVITIPAGFYNRTKFIQLVNDGFNLINGSLTNTDKAPENVGPAAGIAEHTVSPKDYQLPPSSTNNLLKAFEYSYNTWVPIAGVPESAPQTGAQTQTHTSDNVWPYWFFPIYTLPNDPTTFLDEVFLPYVWMTNNQSGFLAGTSKFNLNYDETSQLFFIDYAHSPILDADQREIVQFNSVNTKYFPNIDSDRPVAINTGYKANGRAGGILISRLFSLELDDNFQPVSQTNSGFWQKYLGFGFDDAFQAQFNADFITTNRTFYYVNFNGPVDKISIEYQHTIIHPDPKYFDICTTNSLIPVQFLQQSNWTTPANDRGFSIVVNDIPKTFQSIGNKNILGVGTGQFVEPTSHFLIELNIHNVRNDNYRDKDSYRQVMAVSGKTYPSTASYIQSFADATIQTLIMDEDTYIDRISVRILNPDKTPATELGTNSTVFVKITQPVVVNQPQPPNK